MKNYQKIAVALMVGVSAIGFSAFTSTKADNNFATRYWGNNGTNYVLTTSHDVSLCTSSNNPQCLVQSTDTSIPSTFPKANPSGYAISPVSGSKAGLYNP